MSPASPAPAASIAIRRRQSLPRVRPGADGGVRQENRRKRTESIQEAALDLFLLRGIEAVAIDEIVAKAGTAKGSFYRYFRDKEDVVAAILAPLSLRLDAAFASARVALGAAVGSDETAAAYQLLAAELGAGILDHPRATLLYLQESRSPGRGATKPVRRTADSLAAHGLDLTRIAHERGLLRKIDPRISSLAVIGSVERLLYGLLTNEGLEDPFAIPDALISMVLHGLSPRP